MLKKVVLSTAALVCLAPLVGNRPLLSFPSAVPIHLTTSANIAGYISIAIAKAKMYKTLRATLINQLENEASIEAQQTQDATNHQMQAVVRQPSQSASQMIAHVTTAPKSELIQIANEIVRQRKIYEQLYGDYALAKKEGYERNEAEKATIASYEQLINKIVRYEILQPQLGMALLGTGTASFFTALRQLGVFN